MENDLLKKFIFLVGAALEEEDRIILGRTLIRGKPRGILHLVDERYYQRICWKAAMTRWDAHIERATYDLSLHSPDETEKCFAVFEMKLWMSSRGEQEIPKIKKDIEKLRPLTAPAGFLVVFAANPASEKMHDQLQWLEKGIFELPVPPHEVYSFPTLFNGKPTEFWVAGWQVSPNAISTSLTRPSQATY